ncbi:unnamed protein product [Miscanthus lutarioriparius]|uniref:Ubiquitin-like protease family profile domain-containing protein n=1 Tax=Miscanthus lutarioriparius TaxID=422564 RepID=A0A811NAG5_9POAL|nr:unnamed protein product [Miscanthus lutarioriparius]
MAKYMHVIDAYIKMLKAQEGLKKRPRGTVYLETACLVAIMKRNKEKDETIEANYPNRGTSQRPGLVQRVLGYLKNDMVFIPINVTNTHWYLVVINTDKREVQVLDSLGEMFGRVDLNKIMDDIKEFRLQFTVILLASELNKQKGAPYLDRDENIGSPSDCAIIENSKMADQVSTKKRKHYEKANA